MEIADVIGAVTRELTSREHEGKLARVVVATRSYDTSIDDLWDALTNPERIPRWFLPITGDFRPGGHYALEGNASGEITGCEPPGHLTLTWGWDGQVSWVDLQLKTESEDRTSLRLEHMAHVPDDMWKQFGPGAVGVGWDQALLGLYQHLSTGETVDHKEAEAWLKSDEGKAFVMASSEEWCQASIADGAGEAEAEAAAAQTTAFYTGE